MDVTRRQFLKVVVAVSLVPPLTARETSGCMGYSSELRALVYIKGNDAYLLKMPNWYDQIEVDEWVKAVNTID